MTIAKHLAGITEQALLDRPATAVDTTNTIHALKLLAWYNLLANGTSCHHMITVIQSVS